MKADEDLWHGTAIALATKIETTAKELLELLGMADTILQSDDMPQPWDQWNGAVFAVQDAWCELADGGDLTDNMRKVRVALTKSGL